MADAEAADAPGAQAPENPGFRRPQITPPKPLEVDGDRADNWKLWKQRWLNYCVLAGLNDQSEDYKCAMLLHCIGIEAMRIFNGMKFGEGEDRNNMADILVKYDQHFLGQKQEFFERFQFNRRNQESGESIDEYVSVLRNLAKTCGFCDCMRELLLMDRLLLGISDDKTREELLSTHDLTLSKTIEICRAKEAASLHMKALKSDEINKVTHSSNKKKKSGDGKHKAKGKSGDHGKGKRGRKENPGKEKSGETSDPRATKRKCLFCSQVHLMRKELCPAWGKTCTACGGKNHFQASSKCKHHSVHTIVEDYSTDSSESSSETISGITTDQDHLVNAVQPSNQLIFCEMEVNKKPVKLQIDCGSTVCILPKRYVGNAHIRPEMVNLQMWNKTSLQALGKCKIKVVNPTTKQKFKVDFVIVDKELTPLLSGKAAQKMNLITVNYDKFKVVNAVSSPENDYVQLFPDTFKETPGTLPGKKVHLTTVEGASPVIRSARTLPESRKDAVKAELQRLVDTDMIVPVDEPTDWVSQMSVAEKKSGIRICIDPRPLNKALKREHYKLPVLEDILPELSQACKFSVCDLKAGYLHCELDHPSSLLTTFATPFGRYRWCRLPFGLTVSSEIFQKRLHQALEGLEGVRCIADDVLIWGRTDEEHDERVRLFLQRCCEIGIALNKDKCRFGLQEIPFMGHVVSSSGLKPDPAKIEAIVKMKPPVDKAGVERLRGTVNYLSRFVPKLSDVMRPISDLTRPDVEWTWDSVHDKAFEEIKRLLTQAPVLAYFDSTKELSIQCDASGQGLGAALLQEGRPLAYASRALSDTETRYATIEKEMLAIVFALEKWHQYTYGRHITVYSDHKPLESITKKPLDRAPKRLQGMLVRALAYDIDVQYLNGKEMFLADTLSRAYLPQTCEGAQEEFEIINALTYLVMSDERIGEMRHHTNHDPALQQLKQTILQGWPKDKSQLPPLVTPYFSIHDELAVTDGLIFRGERLVVPKEMRSQIKRDIHAGHQGIDTCLRRAREHVFWPGMSKEIKEWIQTCEACRNFEQTPCKEPLMSHDIPERAWEKIGCDLLSCRGKDYLITVCYKSNFWELDRLNDTKSTTVIKKLKAHLARYGIPRQLVSDNGPQFVSSEFSTFTKSWGIEHTTTSPHHSKANGKVESAVKVAKRMLRKTTKSGEDQYLALLNIRNAPTQGVDSSPAQRLMGRRTRTLLPTTKSLLEPRNPLNPHEMEQLQLNQKRQAKYYNRTAHDLPTLKEGDTVRMKPFVLGQHTWKKAEVTRRLDERSYEVQASGTTYRRNRQHLVKTPQPSNQQDCAKAPHIVPSADCRVATPEQESPHNAGSQNQAEGVTNTNPAPNPCDSVKRSRSGRAIKPPARLKDYVLT